MHLSIYLSIHPTGKVVTTATLEMKKPEPNSSSASRVRAKSIDSGFINSNFARWGSGVRFRQYDL